MPSNQAAWIDAKGAPLRVGDAPLHSAGPGEVVIHSRAVAINPLDWHMQDWGVFIQEWPSIMGCDVAGEVYEVGEGVTKFKPGDRVIAHTINLVSGKPRDAAFAHYCVAPAKRTAILPDAITFESGAVVPLALDAALAGLSVCTPGEAMPGVPIPTLGLPLPTLKSSPLGKSILVYGGSSAVGLMTIQVAVVSGLHVVATSSPSNFDLVRSAGASEVFDYKSASLIEDVVGALAGKGEFVGILDAISVPETYAHDLEILSRLGGRHLACTHPPPPKDELPEGVDAGMLFCVNDLADPVWEAFITPALESGVLRCLPAPLVVGHGLDKIQEALDKSKAGVSAAKLVVTL